MERQYFIHQQVRDQANKLYTRGGHFAGAAGQVLLIINKISNRDEDPFHGIRQTKHGETRLENCIKYDLKGACRLVTVHHKNKVFLLFAGSHEDEEKWLKRNKGAVFAEKEGKVELIARPSKGGDPDLLGEAVLSSGSLCEKLSDRNVDYVLDGFPRSVIRKIDQLQSTSGEEAILDIYNEVENSPKADLFFDVFISLMRGNRDEAVRRIDLEKGEYKEITEDKVGSGENLHVIPEDDPTFADLFDFYVKRADYKEWMLFMHPMQQEMVDLDFKGSSKLLGVSGSGKTCILVKRAVRLAKKYPEEKVLLVTLNRSLANLIRELVDVVSEPGCRERIIVKPFFVVCQDYLHELEPDSEKLYLDVTWKGEEHIDEVWQEFYRCENNNHDASVFWPVQDSLISQGINANVYIREEFDWIRSAIKPGDRRLYLDVERQGRAVPLSKPHREMLLEGLTAWEAKMRAVGVIDYLGLATALYRHVPDLEAEYRCVLVDESQDFGTTELTILRAICKEEENDLFLCGDAAQRVSTKFQSLKESGIKIGSSNSKKIVKNYRNSKEILEAAYTVLSNNIPEGASKTEDFEVLDPDFSSRSGPVPLIIESDSLPHEIASALDYAKSEIMENSGWKVCLAFCGFSAFEISKYAEKMDCCVLDSNAKLSDGSIFFSDLEQTKGFEFDIVIIVNASHGVIPHKNTDEKERLRDLTQFYVALTRAKSQLVVSFSGEKSEFLSSTDDHLLEASWSDYLDESPAGAASPIRIDELREDVDFPDAVPFMSGNHFLCTEAAIGLESLLIAKLRNIVPGTSKTRGQSLVQWKNIGSAYDSCRNDVKSRQAFGPEGLKLFRELCESLSVPEDVAKVKKQALYKGVRELT